MGMRGRRERHQEESAQDNEQGNMAAGGILRAKEAMMRAYPGAQWEQGQVGDYYNDKVCTYELMTKRQWGRSGTPNAMMELVMWHWARLGRALMTDRTQAKGTAWLEIFLDFIFETGYDVRFAQEAKTTLAQDARTFSLASARVLRHMELYGKRAKVSQGITSLVTLGAKRATGVYPLAALFHRGRVTLFLAWHASQNRESMHGEEGVGT